MQTPFNLLVHTATVYRYQPQNPPAQDKNGYVIRDFNSPAANVGTWKCRLQRTSADQGIVDEAQRNIYFGKAYFDPSCPIQENDEFTVAPDQSNAKYIVTGIINRDVMGVLLEISFRFVL